MSLTLEKIKELAKDAKPLVEWFDSTKEKLSPKAVFQGLLDYGLFAEKIPPCFTSTGLAEFAYASMSTLLDETDSNKLKRALDKRAHDFMRYEALRDSNISRHMGVPHPEAYAVQSLAITKHWQDIATHCNKPKQVFSRIYVRHTGTGRIFEMNYKGSERFRLEEEEQKWMTGAQFVVEADIATCFPSIYTHSIPWALNGKAESKKNSVLTDLVGNLLDKCTQNTRDRQTNGLLIGPHASNIISEIILTEIDNELQTKGYRKIKRHVDDYRFYASSYEEAERFIKDLSLALRAYEMSLNEKKTKIIALPRPSEADWVLVLNRHSLPQDRELTFSEIRSFLDLALTCSQSIGKSTPLNYAIKVLARSRNKNNPDENDDIPSRKLNLRAKRMYAQEVMNLALAYPYLASILDEYVFVPYWYPELKEKVTDFATALASLGLRKLYPDSIAHAIFLALKYNFYLSLNNEQLVEIVSLDDSITNVLLFEYAKSHHLKEVLLAITEKANELKRTDKREQDKHWLLIYHTWSEADLAGSGQVFLADLKKSNFSFFSLPKPPSDQGLTAEKAILAEATPAMAASKTQL